MKLQQLLDKLEELEVDPSQVDLRVLDENGYTYNVTDLKIEEASVDTTHFWVIVEEA